MVDYKNITMKSYIRQLRWQKRISVESVWKCEDIVIFTEHETILILADYSDILYLTVKLCDTQIIRNPTYLHSYLSNFDFL